jgi:transposase-like protein
MEDTEYLAKLKEMKSEYDMEHVEKVYNDGAVCECPMCGSSDIIFLGQLGKREHYRCRDCYWDFSCL